MYIDTYMLFLFFFHYDLVFLECLFCQVWIFKIVKGDVSVLSMVTVACWFL